MSNSRLLTGKVKKVYGDRLTVDRYNNLSLSQAEPDLGLPSKDGSILIGSTSSNIRTWSNMVTVSTTGTVTVFSTASDRYSYNTNALTILGGVSIAKNLHVGGIAYLNGAEILTTQSGLSSVLGDSVINQILKVNTTTNATSTTTGALQVMGGVGIGGTLFVGGLRNTGTSVIVYYNSSTGELSYGIPTGGGGIVSPFAEIFTVTNTATAISTITGALQVAGGVGIGGNLYVGGEIVAQKLTIEYTTVTTTLLTTDDIIRTYNTTSAVSTTTGALQVAGGVGIRGNLYVGGTAYLNDAEILTTSSRITSVEGLTQITQDFVVNTTTNATSTLTGALQVRGGVGIAKDVRIGQNLYVSGSVFLGDAQVLTTQSGITSNLGRTEISQDLFVNTTTNSTSTDTGSIVTLGGVGIARDVNIGGGLVAGGINLLNRNQHIWYVDPVIGANDYTKNDHPLAPARTIKYILGYADSGDTVFIQPGTYYEEFPLTIPDGVSVRGAGLREVIIYPTTATNTATAFLLNGASLISDFTVGGFFEPGYAFEFAPGAVTTTKSPYIERFSVITKGSVTSASDPYGFDANNAGGGVKIDGAQVATTSTQASMMFNEATFIVPNATGLYMTNGARAEVINTFFYFADKAINAVSSTVGYAGVGKTKLKLGGISGTLSVGDTLFYKTSGGTTLASGTIASVDGSYVYITGAQWGFDTPSTRPAKVISVLGDVSVDTSVKKYGTGSAKFDGVGDGLTIPSSSDFGFGTGDFTIEGWFYHISNATQDMFEFRVNGTSQAAISLSYSSSNLVLTVLGSARITGTSALPSNNTWYHVVLMRASGNTRLYVNGAQVGSTWTDSTNYITAPLFIGTRYDNAIPWNGYIDDIRISKGIAQYSTSSFVTPTQALTTDEYTVLMLHANGALGSTVFTDDNVTPQVIYSTGTTYASATSIELADYHQFGAEIRSIGSAAIFGNSGVTANGTGTDIKLIAFNLSHIGSGKDSTDDISLVIQANEVIQLNNGRIYFQTVDQSGDFRVGNSFLVNQRTGDVSFGDAKVNLSNVSQLTITDGVNNTLILPTSIGVGNLVLSGGSLVTQAGNLTLDPAGTSTIVNSNLEVTGSLSVAGSNVVTSNDLLTVTYPAAYITIDPTEFAGLPTLAGTSTAYGSYNFGTVLDIRTFNDYNTGTNSGFYSINDANTTPGYIAYVGFTGITEFNRVVLNINYTQNSGHTINVDMYNYVNAAWDTFAVYSGLPGWYQLALGVIDSGPYISGGAVTLRLNHISGGNTGHRTWIDYIALEKSKQGGQGPRGATGVTGPTGTAGLTTSTTSTFLFLNVTTATSTVSAAVVAYGGMGIGGGLYVRGDINYTGNIYQNGSVIGAAGYTGSIGFTGSKGDIGYAGSRGAAGFTGSAGELGYTGSQGPQGTAGSGGAAGSTGYTGSIGYTGSKGDMGYTGPIGYTGSGGYTGSKGTDGLNGFTGSKGEKGDNATGGASTVLERHYRKPGVLTVNTGTEKWYVPVDSTITSIRSRVEVAPQGAQPLTVAIKVNSLTTTTVSINSATTISSLNTSTVNLRTNDYVTVDVLNIGNTVAGSDLTVTFTYIRNI